MLQIIRQLKLTAMNDLNDSNNPSVKTDGNEDLNDSNNPSVKTDGNE